MTQLTTAGFHHVTLVCRDARQTIRFYRDILGLSLVKVTVNFDRTDTYHLYFGDPAGTPGTLLTFFEWPEAKRGRYGVGGIHHVALGTRDDDTLLMWKRWLTENGVRVTGPYDRGYFTSIYFTDPDGQVIEIATDGPGFQIDEPANALGRNLMIPPESRFPEGRDEAAIRAKTWTEPIDAPTEAMRLHGIHHVTGMTDDLDAAHDFYTRLLGLRLVKMSLNQDDPDTRHYFWANYDGETVAYGSDFTLFGWRDTSPRAREGAGQTHHVAWRAVDEDELHSWREYLLGFGHEVTDVRDRKYFKSIYFRTHDGLLVEIATDGPSFGIDETELGSAVQLPDWLEDRRDEIVSSLRPLI
ncbi:MAG: VOC family protein [Thermomicrobiales bacterium]|nr:VOC family protein [Thermomicrobiales bacterium]